MAKGTHDYQADPRNATIRISIDGKLLPRDEAKVSVFDSGFMLGDGIWERKNGDATLLISSKIEKRSVPISTSVLIDNGQRYDSTATQ